MDWAKTTARRDEKKYVLGFIASYIKDLLTEPYQHAKAGQTGCYFAGNIFKLVFVNEIVVL